MGTEDSPKTSDPKVEGGGGTPLTPGQEAAPQFLTVADFETKMAGAQRAMLQQVEQAREQGRREMQGRKDREIAERTRQYDERLSTLGGLYASTARELGADEDQLRAISETFQGQVREQDQERELQMYRDYMRQQEAYDTTQRLITNVLALAGIPKDHPALVLQGTEEEFYASVQKAQEQMKAPGGGEPSTPGTQPGSQTAAGPGQPLTGGADVLGGGTGVATTPNPIADETDPDKLLKMGLSSAKSK